MMSSDIAGYTYQAESLCPSCTITKLGKGINASAIGYAYDAHAVIRLVAAVENVNLDDERSYDSNDFPKPFTFDQVLEDEKCDQCNGRLC